MSDLDPHEALPTPEPYMNGDFAEDGHVVGNVDEVGSFSISFLAAFIFVGGF